MEETDRQTAGGTERETERMRDGWTERQTCQHAEANNNNNGQTLCE